MDQIIAPLLNGGISAVMAAAFIYFCWHVVTKTIPEQRVEFLAALRDHDTSCAAERKESAERHERMSSRMADAVGGLTAEIKAMRADREAGK